MSICIVIMIDFIITITITIMMIIIITITIFISIIIFTTITSIIMWGFRDFKIWNVFLLMDSGFGVQGLGFRV